MMMGSDNGLWIEPDTIVEQQEVFIKGIYQASNGVIWFRFDQGILSYDGVSWIKHGIYWGNYGAIGLKAGAHEATDGTIWFNGSFTSAPSTLDGSPVSSCQGRGMGR